MYAKNAVPLYEGDGYLHAGPASVAKNRDTPAAWVDLIEIEREAQRLRGEALAELLGRFRTWVKLKLSRKRTSALDNYLAGSTSLAEVERRLREAERDGRYFTS
ncbi:MAG: hypothetical protein WBO23_03635 [Burkholderiales bacterium]